jgi:hypothetical protein
LQGTSTLVAIWTNGSREERKKKKERERKKEETGGVRKKKMHKRKETPKMDEDTKWRGRKLDTKATRTKKHIKK